MVELAAEMSRTSSSCWMSRACCSGKCILPSAHGDSCCERDHRYLDFSWRRAECLHLQRCPTTVALCWWVWWDENLWTRKSPDPCFDQAAISCRTADWQKVGTGETNYVADSQSFRTFFYVKLAATSTASESSPWAIALAGELRCPDCIEAKKPRPPPPASTGEMPGLFEQVGTDVFEVEFEDDDGNGCKAKFILWRDRASGLAQADLLQIYGGPQMEKNWEPKTADVIRSFGRWLLNNPAPRWVITDSATYYTSAELLDYMSRSGVGVLTAPAEAHWVLGAEEGCVGVLKATILRIKKETPQLGIGDLMNLAVHGHNQTIGPTGFSPFQWTRGADAPEPSLPVGIDVRKAFGGMLKLKARAKIAYEMESAKSRMSKLSNATGRPSNQYKTGALVMVWRQRMRPGKVSGHWAGPLRVLLQEGNTLWLATGANLVKAKLNQVRHVTKREEQQASLEGTAILRMPVTVESLLRDFTGKHFTNICGEVPSELQRHMDVAGTTVSVEPASRVQPDTWRLMNGKWLIRVHNAPRLALFSPARSSQLPVEEERLTGLRRSYIKPSLPGAEEILIEDNYREVDDPHRLLQERWIGETWFEIMAPEVDPQPPAKRQKSKKNLEETTATTPKESVAPEEHQVPGDVLPRIQDDAIVPATPRSSGGQAVTGNACAVADCTLPGGHDGPHVDNRNRRFIWNPHNGKMFDDEDSSSSSSSSSSTSSSSDEELVPDDEISKKKRKKKHETHLISYLKHDDDPVFCLEIEIKAKDVQWLANHPNRATAWMSRKIMEKGKEKHWNRLTLEEKQGFDQAQAKELAQVLQSKALRSLTEQEAANLDFSKVMGMRWVLTTKADGTPKARLVVLGYQAHNLTTVETSSPTMSRLSRNMILVMCANLGLRIRAGDATSAFLQADQDMEDQDLAVWAPAELAVLFGADPERPILPLKIRWAFYGLVNAPRAWYEHLVQTLLRIGWRQMQSDKCVFVLYDMEQADHPVVSVIGMHVDDLLVGGLESSPLFQRCFKELVDAYRWGKWEQDEIKFTGCRIRQSSNGQIKIDQEEYTTKWIEESPIRPERARQGKSAATPSEISSLRGAIGTIAWRASQTSPQFLADAGLLLSEIPFATVDTLVKTNKLVREMKHEASQVLIFHPWQVPWQQVAVVAWADASQKNRPDSTMGIITGLAPVGILSGEEHGVSIVHWRSSKTPRQVLGSNGAEVQAVTEAEDGVFHIRALWCELHAKTFGRHDLYQMVKENSSGAVVMDTRGIFDAATRNASSLHGLRSSRAGYELTISVAQAKSIGTAFRWVHGGAQLGDGLTKWGARKILLQFFANGQR